MKGFWRVAATATMALTILAACGASEPASPQGVTVTDALGNDITLAEVPDRIISLTPSNTEILFGLGLADEIVGVNDSDNYPAEAGEKQKVGGTDYNLEMIVALEPDIVFAHESSMSTLTMAIPQLEAAGVTVFVVENAESFDETYATIEDIGKLTGKEAEAAEMISNIQTDVLQVQKVIEGQPAKSAFLVVGGSPDIYVAGQGTFMNEMLKAINVENAVKEEGWPLYSPEQFIAANPDSLIFTYEGDDDIIRNNPAFAVMDAVEKDALTVVDGDTTSRQGPRLAEGVEELARAIYPEAFHE
ncbi:MAG: ABC transporter substrate-binding protein [Solibacillus sp.]